MNVCYESTYEKVFMERLQGVGWTPTFGAEDLKMVTSSIDRKEPALVAPVARIESWNAANPDGFISIRATTDIDFQKRMQ